MSVTIVCDRCGGVVEQNARRGDWLNDNAGGGVLHRKLDASFWPKPTLQGRAAGKPADMCEPCGAAFVAWWKAAAS